MRPAATGPELLRSLASMPFLDRLELAAVAGRSRGAVYKAVERLRQAGMVESVPHGTELTPTTRRYSLNADGLRRLANHQSADVDGLLREYPVSDRWQRSLLERLDAVAVIYRLAASLATVTLPVRFHWYRGHPLDAAIALPDGRTVGILRQGHTADRTGFAKRLWRLGRGPLPGAVLVLVPDGMRLRQARRMLAGAPFPAYLALERDAALAEVNATVWRVPSGNSALDLRYVLDRLPPGGELPAECQLRVSVDPPVTGWS